MNKTLLNFGLLVLRVSAGVSMISLHGFSKIQNPSGIIKTLEAKKFIFPHVLGYLSIGAEAILPIFIIVGLFTRLSSLFITINMFVAAFVFHLAINGDPAKVWEKAYLYMVIFFFLSLAGSGDFALEKVLKIKRRW